MVGGTALDALQRDRGGPRCPRSAIVVSAAPLVAIVATRANATVEVGARQTFAATGTYTDGSMTDITGQVSNVNAKSHVVRWLLAEVVQAMFSFRSGSGTVTGLPKGVQPRC